MRIITGSAKGVKLATLEGEATRPTSERAKEAVFSMIQFDLEGRKVLDLFAGSGQMGLEALSRGAVGAIFVDISNAACDIIRVNAKKTRLEDRCRVFCRDYKSFLGSVKEKFDIVFIDPPYAMRAVPDALYALLERGALKKTTFAVCESAEDDIFSGHEDLRGKFETIRKAKYGAAYITLISPKGEAL